MPQLTSYQTNSFYQTLDIIKIIFPFPQTNFSWKNNIDTLKIISLADYTPQQTRVLA